MKTNDITLYTYQIIISIDHNIKFNQLTDPSFSNCPQDDKAVEVEEGWAGLLASIGLLVASVAELFVSGYTCLTLAPKLCDCLRPEADQANETITVDGKALKTRNMVHQWVIAQNHVSKNQPIYVVQPVMPVHTIMHQVSHASMNIHVDENVCGKVGNVGYTRN